MTVEFTHMMPAHNVTVACSICGAAITDWMYTTDPETGARITAPRVNQERHRAWHEQEAKE
jgi:hypothetical protein